LDVVGAAPRFDEAHDVVEVRIDWNAPRLAANPTVVGTMV